MEAAINFRSQLGRELLDETGPGLRPGPNGEHVYVFAPGQVERWINRGRCPVCKAKADGLRLLGWDQPVERSMNLGGWWDSYPDGPPTASCRSLPCGCTWVTTAPAAAGGPE